VSAPFPKGGSEYGGYPDLIQPEPHDYKSSPSEQAMATYLTDPADPESSVESVVEDIRARGRATRDRYYD
jgi:hypothetical protein